MGRWEEEGEKGRVLTSLIAVRALELAYRVSVSGNPRGPRILLISQSCFWLPSRSIAYYRAIIGNIAFS